MMPFNIDFVESFDKETIIAELRRIADLLGTSTLSRKDIDAHGHLSSSVVLKRFGTLRKAIQEASLTPFRFNKATDEELCLILHRALDANSRKIRAQSVQDGTWDIWIPDFWGHFYPSIRQLEEGATRGR